MAEEKHSASFRLDVYQASFVQAVGDLLDALGWEGYIEDYPTNKNGIALLCTDMEIKREATMRHNMPFGRRLSRIYIMLRALIDENQEITEKDTEQRFVILFRLINEIYKSSHK